MPDVQGTRITELTQITSPGSGDKFLMDSSSSGARGIDYEQLATAILNKLTSKTYSINGADQTLVAAASEGAYGRIGQLTNQNIDNMYGVSKCGSYWINCGDVSLTGTLPTTAGQGLLCVKKQSNTLYRQIYIPVSSGMDLVARYYNTGTSTWTEWNDPDITKRLRANIWRTVGNSAGSTREEVLATIDSFFGKPGASHQSGYCNGNAPGLLGLPASSFYLDMYANSDNFRMIVARKVDGTAVYQLVKQSGTWASNWVKFEGTIVS